MALARGLTPNAAHPALAARWLGQRDQRAPVEPVPAVEFMQAVRERCPLQTRLHRVQVDPREVFVLVPEHEAALFAGEVAALRKLAADAGVGLLVEQPTLEIK